MLFHTYVVVCLALNPTMCREMEIVPADYRLVASVTDCAMGGIIYGGTGMVDTDGTEWIIKGVRCKTEGSKPITDIQRRLRAAVDP